MTELMNPAARYAFIGEQIVKMKASAADLGAARKFLQERIEAATSLQLAPRDRAALRAFLGGLGRRLRAGEIDDRTAHAGINQLIMAAKSNSPDVLSIIYAG